MFIVKIFNNNVPRETVFYDINKAISFFEDNSTYNELIEKYKASFQLIFSFSCIEVAFSSIFLAHTKSATIDEDFWLRDFSGKNSFTIKNIKLPKRKIKSIIIP